MRHWRYGRGWLRLTAFLVIIGSLMVLGCNEEDPFPPFQEATIADFASSTFSFDASFLDVSFAPQRVTLDFGAAVNNTAPFTMRFSGTPGTVISGTGIVGTLQLQVDAITVDGASVNTTQIGNVVFRVGTIAYTLEVEVTREGDLVAFRFTNPQTGEVLELTNF
jgi:hypothetical protein